MIFIAAIIVVGVVTVMLDNRTHSYLSSLFVGLSVGSLIFTGASALLPMEKTTEETRYELQATTLGSDSEYFVGTGPNNSGEAYYAITENGEAKNKSGKAELVMVVEDGKKELLIEEMKVQNLWLKPWTNIINTRYYFHVPEGSSKEDFTPGK